MKILHIANHFHPCVGGVEGAVEGLCKGLLQRGHVSDVACLDTCAYTGDKLLHFDAHEGIKIFRLTYLNLKFYKPAPGVLRLLDDYDIIHVHGVGFFSDFVSITGPIHKKPLVLTTHGGFFHTEKLKHLKILYFNWNRLSMKAFEKVIATSRNDEAIFSPICPDIVHIPNGIPLDEFRVNRRLEPYTLLFVGRISKNKRIERLIETTALLKKHVPEVKLNIVGEDWEGIRGELEVLANKLNVMKNVDFLGKIERAELIEQLSKANFFVSASRFEGFGISVIEAMAAGCVPIVNDINAFREFIDDGKNGFIVNFSNPWSASNRIQALFETDLSNILKAARKTASRYSIDEVVGRTEDIYQHIVKKREA